MTVIFYRIITIEEQHKTHTILTSRFIFFYFDLYKNIRINLYDFRLFNRRNFELRINFSYTTKINRYKIIIITISPNLSSRVHYYNF
jgi:hypothetical protein